MRYSSLSSSSAIALAIACANAVAFAQADDTSTPDFLREVRPIIAGSCFPCHGMDEGTREGGLRLDIAGAAQQGGDSGEPAIVPGDPDSSQLMERIASEDDSLRMPPADSKPPLTAEQIDILRRWIAAGAPYREHWGLVAPEKPALPASTVTAPPENEIDQFIHARLQQDGQRPSPPASRETLLRRVYLDLIGLPPSPEEVDAFLADESPDAYERQVEKLLASQHFGEKWARHWLDLARYADSDGYEKDLPRKQYLWRDWIINAINRDMPYDQFVIEQIAGDLLPNATQDQRIATGFLRNGMVNEEGAIIHEQFRMEGLFDRMDCIGKAVLGLTIQCAQCHSHKYDPISQEEYYRLLAFLNDDYEAISWVYTEAQQRKIADIEQEDRNLELRFKTENPDWETRFALWEAEAKSVADLWKVLPPIDPEWIGGLAHPEALADNSVITLGFRPEGGDLVVLGETNLARVTGLRLDALTHGDLPFGGPGRSVRGTFAVSEVIIEAQPLDQPDAAWERVSVAEVTADFAEAERELVAPFRRGDDDKRVVGPPGFLADDKLETAWGSDRGPGRRHQDLAAHLKFGKPVNYPNGARFKITLKFGHGGSDAHGRSNNFLGRFRLSITDSDAPLRPLSRYISEAICTPANRRTPEQNRRLFAYWREQDPGGSEINAAVDKLWSQYPEGETVLNLAARLPEHRRQTAILERGDWQKPAVAVTPGVPSALHPLPADGELNRLALANWLVDRRSPTTARVAVNRLWQAIFGVGIVETAEDFGIRASAPSHPQLLDWLAVDLMEHDWSVKRLIRTIVLSATYRQDSRVSPELLELDPKNRLLARGPRFRLEAEAARDTVLTAAGLLNRKSGGPSFFPPVPESMFATSFIPVDFWDTAPAPERYRRSIYVFRRRSMPDPVLSSFDAPNGDFACPRRSRSNTPLAALTALNETVFVEAARALALRVLREADANPRDRARFAFMLCTNRSATDAEIDEILSLYQSQLERLRDGWISPRAIATGKFEELPELPPGVTPVEAAAWAIVSRVLLNLDETFTKS